MSNITKQILKTRTYNQITSGVSTFWKDSLFENLKNLSSRAKGAKGEHLVAEAMSALGHHSPFKKDGKPYKPKGSGTDFDLFINRLKIEVKLSTAWDETPSKFKWQQLRSMQDYDRVVFVGVNPNQFDMWWCTKKDLEKHIFNKSEYRQHAGKDGDQDLYWISTEGSTNIPSWFRPIQTF